jgi:hypothetical protein
MLLAHLPSARALKIFGELKRDIFPIAYQSGWYPISREEKSRVLRLRAEDMRLNQ